MPTIPKGPRLWFQPTRYDKTGKLKENGTWVIRDGTIKRSTGCALGDRQEAERRLIEYIQSTHIAPRTRDRDPFEVKIADVLAIYATDNAARQAIPVEVLGRIARLGEFFGEKVLGDINGSLCRAYVEHRKGAGAARRELEDLRAAINYHYREGYCTLPTPIVLPEKGKPRDRWLTRSEAARLLWSAWRMTQTWKGQDSDRRTGRHIARFILVGLYTGTRAGAICGASFVPREDSGYIDLDRGVFYRRAALARETKKRQPPVPIPDRLLVHLRRWRDKHVSHQFVVEWNGDPVARINKAFKRACAAAGLGDDVTPHTLRHTAATWMMNNGVEAWEAAGFLGMSTKILEDTYGHHSPNHLEGARKGISARQLPDRMTGNIGGNKGERKGGKNVIRLTA